MNRLATSLGTLIALMAIAPAAHATSYSFSIGGRRIYVEAPRNCRSVSCVSVSSRSLKTTNEVRTARVPTPAPAPAVPVPQPVAPAAQVAPAPVAAVVPPPAPPPALPPPPPAPPAPILAAASSPSIAPPPPPKPEAPKFEPLSPNPPRVDLQRTDPLKTAALNPLPDSKPSAPTKRSDDEAYLPLGEWENPGAKGTVRIERCGPALCGFAHTDASSRGESVLVNMKPKAHDAWSGSIYNRADGGSYGSYYATMTLKASDKLYVETCAVGRFWCTGNDWTRVEEPRDKPAATSRQWNEKL